MIKNSEETEYWLKSDVVKSEIINFIFISIVNVIVSVIVVDVSTRFSISNGIRIDISIIMIIDFIITITSPMEVIFKPRWFVS